jgi:hypothetical protein
MFKDGTYSAWFKTPRAQGTGIVRFENGKISGGDSIMTYDGSYEVSGDRFTATVTTRRHTAGHATVFGIDDLVLKLDGVSKGGDSQVHRHGGRGAGSDVRGDPHSLSGGVSERPAGPRAGELRSQQAAEVDEAFPWSLSAGISRPQGRLPTASRSNLKQECPLRSRPLPMRRTGGYRRRFGDTRRFFGLIPVMRSGGYSITAPRWGR